MKCNDCKSVVIAKDLWKHGRKRESLMLKGPRRAVCIMTKVRLRAVGSFQEHPLRRAPKQKRARMVCIMQEHEPSPLFVSRSTQRPMNGFLGHLRDKRACRDFSVILGNRGAKVEALNAKPMLPTGESPREWHVLLTVGPTQQF